MDTIPAATPPFAPHAEFWARLGLPCLGESPASLGQAWMQEVTQFLAARLRADADALVALGGCTRPDEIAEIQRRWLSEMGEAYAGAGTRMMRLAVPAGSLPPDEGAGA